MKRIILMMAVLGFGLGLYAQDNDSPRAGGQYTQKVDFIDEATGLKFSIKSYDPCTVALMSSGDLIMTSRPDDNDHGYMDGYVDYGYMDMPKNEYSGDIVIPHQIKYGPTWFDVSRISYGTFNQCVNLTSVTLPRDLFDVRRGAFYGCTSLTEVKRGDVRPHWPCMPDNTIFYPDAFRGCTSLRKVDLTMAGWCWDGIFADCPNLEEVSLFTTGNQAKAFKGRTVPSLKKLILYSYESDWLDTSDLELNYFFPEEYANTEVVVSKGQLAKYKAHFMWSGFQNIHEVGES
ncbi:MAG: leucine-rich repeat domain-containing protein, partial [Muribaculaceae bacterium]|nr:leucine-rich repeat domain-containing protein [Muribaculaceae bacterium]